MAVAVGAACVGQMRSVAGQYYYRVAAWEAVQVHVVLSVSEQVVIV